ncbi:hypothetical protein ABZ345_03920 [Lentzea sp. NPDC005914]|uniref:hypothetical protein n=1 Tax=Lentzea sp. NPDC005914 TaxID=3154572 RepID=UPI0033F3C25D
MLSGGRGAGATDLRRRLTDDLLKVGVTRLVFDSREVQDDDVVLSHEGKPVHPMVRPVKMCRRTRVELMNLQVR